MTRHPTCPPPSERRRHLVLLVPAGEVPQVQAVLERGGKTVQVRCPFCRRRHVHGVPQGDGYGPRLSHCHDREPRTYVLVPSRAQTA